MAKGNAQFSNDQDVLLSVGPFQGLDLTTSPYYVAQNNCVSTQNVSINRVYGSYCTAQGRVGNYCAGGPTYVVYAIGITSQLINNSSVDYSPGIYILYFDSTSGNLYGYYAGYGQTPTAITGWAGTPPSSSYLDLFATPYESKWVFAGKYVFPDCPMTRPQFVASIDLSGPYAGTQAYDWGIAAPSTACTAAAGASGSLNGTYYYAVTFINTLLSPNAESGTSPFSAPVTVTNTEVNLTSIPVSTDPQVGGRNIYRFGGTIGGTPLLVGTIADNVTTTFSDATADSVVTGQQLILTQDPAPVGGWQAIANHKGRMWGFGSYATGKSDLWFSGYLQYTSFDSVNQVLDCGTGSDDQPIALASLESVLIALKQQSIWVCYGDTQNDFIARKVYSIGCVSKGSVATGYGKIYWLGADGVYLFDGADAPVNISDGSPVQGGIRSAIDAYLSQYDAQSITVRGFIYKRTYYISFCSLTNTFPDTTYGYDLISGGWTTLPYSATAIGFTQNTFNNPSSVLGYPLVLGASLEDNGQLDQWFGAETDYTASIVANWTTGVTDSGAVGVTKEYRYLEVIGPTQTATVEVILYVNPGTNQTQLGPFYFDMSIGTNRHRQSLPAGSVGYEIQAVISTNTLAKTVIDKVAVLGYVQRAESPPPANG